MAHDLALTIGRRIRERRYELGLTQVQLAEQVGVHQVTVSGWECGTQTPRRQHEAAILDALDAWGCGLFDPPRPAKAAS